MSEIPLSISVTVRAYNAGDTLEECLLAIKRSSYNYHELIVVDDGSTDTTKKIADRHADKVIAIPENMGMVHARNAALKEVSGDIIVNVDSDVVVAQDTLKIISSYLSNHPEVDAVTGRLSEEHPCHNFFSQYKNLYMNYVFGRLPEKINFLYGSIFAIRKKAVRLVDTGYTYGEDTYIGMMIAREGGEIRLLKNLTVIHLKKYNLLSFFKNDIRVPFYWAKMIVLQGGWRQLFKNGTGFAHASRGQLISVSLAASILIIIALSLFGHPAHLLMLLSILIWSLLNFNFLDFLKKERGFVFAMTAFFVTFFDNIVMCSGAIAGLVAGAIAWINRSALGAFKQ